MAVSSTKLKKIIEKAGAILQKNRGHGSHQVYKMGVETIVIPHPKKDLPYGTVKHILEQCGLDPKKYI